MKKILSVCLMIVFVVSIVAAQPGINEPGTGAEDPELRDRVKMILSFRNAGYDYATLLLSSLLV